MTSSREWSAANDQYGSLSQWAAREPGSRRKKIAGYLKAANELRQTYQQSYMQSWSHHDALSDGLETMPGAFPSAAVSKNGDEEMIIFPSYARRHVRMNKEPADRTSSTDPAFERGAVSSDNRISGGDAEYWRREWDRHEDETAIVDVEVRGWIYTPHKGPMNRKTRVAVGLARQMVGIPAPNASSPGASTTSSRSSSPKGLREKIEAHDAKHEQEIVLKEAQTILRQGEIEAEQATKGAYSEEPGTDGDFSSQGNVKNVHISQLAEPQRPHASHGASEYASESEANSRRGWIDPANMSQAELAVANSNLMARLKPFMANPIPNVSISAFFYNDETSRQKTIDTDAYGHFTINAALDFVPTHVRVLGSDRLSATKAVSIVEPKGVSVISDIDDTIKHSAIGSGAREIFRNVFIRDLGELNIQGVREWYSRLAELGAQFHYVSNSPWQLYPVLSKFFAMSGLPQGSFHLKQYSGMFQGIFEPVAERKKGTLERIMRDFPDRRFVLVGDSGEADLEVYTDAVIEHPGRILGVFIRDVTTTRKAKFFDSAGDALLNDKSLRASRSNPDIAGELGTRRYGANEGLAHGTGNGLSSRPMLRDDQRGRTDTDANSEEFRPQLPARRKTEPVEEEDLIDLWSEDGNIAPIKLTKRPPVPKKPQQMKSAPRTPQHNERKSVTQPQADSSARTQASSLRETAETKPTGGPAFTSTNMPLASPRLNPDSKTPPPKDEAAPPLPPRKPPSRMGTMSQYAASIYNSTTASAVNSVKYLSNGTDSRPQSLHNNYSDEDSGLAYGTAESHDLQGYGTPALSKKEEMWKRRWETASRILRDKGVMLRSWRVGTDVQADSVRLVQRALKEDFSGRKEGGLPSRPA